MDDLVTLWERPTAKEMFMIAGWHQWADAGTISSELPQYLIEKLNARQIGEISTYGFYLFQVPGTHHFLRPQVKLEGGYRRSIEARTNEIYFAGDEERGLIIFLGHEPQLNAEEYADAFLDLVEELEVQRVAILGGVFGPVPFDKDREIACVYSLPQMRPELDTYAVRFSDYEGGATIGTFIADRAEERELELLVFYGLVPAYDFTSVVDHHQSLRIERDFKAWYDIMRRLNHMFGLTLDLGELEEQSEVLLSSVRERIHEMNEQTPEVDLHQFIAQMAEDYAERPFVPLGEVWEQGLRDIFGEEGDE
jgi:proteasome assembly chaperone (PAC2) family protein